MQTLLTKQEYITWRQATGLPPKSIRTIKRWIDTHKLWTTPDANGQPLIDPTRNPDHNTPDTDNTGTKVGKKRLAKNRGLPDNLHPYDKNGTTYYRYNVPKNVDVPKEERQQPMGTDKAKAVSAANQLNQHYSLGADLVQQAMARIETGRTGGQGKDICRYIDHLNTKILPARRVGKRKEPMSPDTLNLYRQNGNRWKAAFTGHTFDTLTQARIADYLNGLSTDEVYNKHRAQLGVLYKHAISDGIASENWPHKIIPRDGNATQRVRLTLEAYKAIYQQAPPAIQSAMELALNLLQRRTDIQTMAFTDRKNDGYLYQIISKTKSRGLEAYIRIPLDLPCIHSERASKTLNDIINTCRDNTWSPYLVHHKPGRRQKSKEKKHKTQLSRKQISDGFKAARDTTGHYNHIPNKMHRPGLHECIALGEHLMQKAGWSEEWIQLLRGHKKIETTRIYLEDHEWTTIPMPN